MTKVNRSTASLFIVALVAVFSSVLSSDSFAQAAANPDTLKETCKKHLTLTATASDKKKQDTVRDLLCDKAASLFNGEEAVPASPAFTTLGVTTDKTIRPRTPDELATSILNNVDPNGTFQQGLALDFAPYMLFAGDKVTLKKYQDNYATRFLSRTQFSLATTKGQETADKSTRLAVGLNITPWLGYDPRDGGKGSFLECFGDSLTNFLDNVAVPPPFPGATEEQKQNHIENTLRNGAKSHLEDDANYKKCRDASRKKQSNSSGWTLGLAPSWTSKDGDLDDLDWSGVALWSSLALNLDASEIPGLGDVPGLGSLGQAILHVRYKKDELVSNPARSGAFIKQDSLILAGKIRFDGPDGAPTDILRDMKFSLEGALVDASRGNGVDDTFVQWTADAELRLPYIGENFWLILSAGRTQDRAEKEETIAGLSVKWAFNDNKPKKAK